MPWPLPALLSWGVAWAVFVLLQAAKAPSLVALAGAAFVGVLPATSARWASTRWRQVFIAFGFPLSLWVSGVGGDIPPWAWLLPLLALIAIYPLKSWKDAPLFPTPRGALQGLDRLAPLPSRSRVLEAGCGLGHGLRELHAAYPDARIDGLEWSWPLCWISQWRCRFAAVRRGDIWQADWSPYAMVYLFQRPESMPRAMTKAGRELRPGAWMASLEFEATGLVADAVHACPDGRPVWLYRQPFSIRTPLAPLAPADGS